MPSITLKSVPPELHAQLKKEAEANFRALDEEVLSRVQQSFDVEAALNTNRDQRWIDEALASGSEQPLTRKNFDAALKRGLKRARKVA